MRYEQDLMKNPEVMEEALIMISGFHKMSVVLGTIATLIDAGEIRVTPRPGMDQTVDAVRDAITAAAQTCKEIEDRRLRKR